MAIDIIAGGVLALCILAAAHHVALYPRIVAWAARERRAAARPAPPLSPNAVHPSIEIVVPAHNEEGVIAAKIANLASLDYPHDRLTITVALDGCTDDTEARARAALSDVGAPPWIRLVVQADNLGKRQTLNRAIGESAAEIVAVSDASAVVGADALKRAAAAFVADPQLGVVTGTYRLAEAGDPGEAAYWRRRTDVKADEAALAAPMGAHGAFYLFRRRFWRPLELGVVNDDFVLPMRIVEAGARAVHDPAIVATELETTQPDQEFWRRVRIGAGNLQQTVLLRGLGRPSRGWLAYLFWGGKGFRPLLPFVAALAGLATLVLALNGSWLATIAAGLGAAGLALTGLIAWRRDWPWPRPLRTGAYFVQGLIASGIGGAQYLIYGGARRWSAASAPVDPREDYPPTTVAISKRALDIVVALAVLAVLAVLIIPIAIAIRLDSKGPIFYRQLRVGRQTASLTTLFPLIKFRSMYVDAEARTGAVWATKDDPRVTRVGRFMRKTRLDELPQAVNVLLGHMSVIGPRPERPKFFKKLETEIPFYIERTYGLRPGITGLAQVSTGYDESIEDVRKKVLYDHAYAARLTSWPEWLRTDVEILLKTVGVVVTRKGQ